MLLTNAHIHDAVHPDAYFGSIRIENGKIAAVGQTLRPTADEAVTDLHGMSVYPGFIDAHSHLGLDCYGLAEGKDYNEWGDIVSCQLRGIDSFNPQDRAIPLALAGGVTTVCTGPGSANVLCGTALAVKTRGTCVDDMAINPAVAMKCAFGENPRRFYRDKGNSSRMSTASKLRDMLFKAREYMIKKEAAGDDPFKRPGFDMKMEALIPVLKGEMPLKTHAHRADDLCTAIRIAKEFGVKMTLEHCTEGHLIVKELCRAGFPVAVGPTLMSPSKLEVQNMTFDTPGILSKAGLQVSIITDAPVIPQQYLRLCAGLAIQSGMEPFAALQAITINPAKHLGLEARIGSLEHGKDADVVVTDGDPTVSSTRILAVYVDGEKAVG